MKGKVWLFVANYGIEYAKIKVGNDRIAASARVQIRKHAREIPMTGKEPLSSKQLLRL